MRAAADEHPDVVILDLGLPDMSGIEVIGGLRGWLTVPIIVLSARTDSADKVEALDAGADDYVTKPFGMDEFLARLRAAIRRGAAATETDEPVIETASFTVDLAAKKVTKNGTEVHLTPTEWGMLEMLVRNRGKLVGREELLKEVWGPAYAKETHYLRVYLAQLRRKLEDDPSHPVHLLTEAGHGLPLSGVSSFLGERNQPRAHQVRPLVDDEVRGVDRFQRVVVGVGGLGRGQRRWTTTSPVPNSARIGTVARRVSGSLRLRYFAQSGTCGRCPGPRGRTPDRGTGRRRRAASSIGIADPRAKITLSTYRVCRCTEIPNVATGS